MSSRTLKVASPAMRGDDAAAWERTINAQLRDWKIDYAVPTDGTYDTLDRSMTASIAYGLGMDTRALVAGLSPQLRTKIRSKNLTESERVNYKARADWRARLRKRLEDSKGPQVHRLVAKVTQDSWSYHPGVHDGIDLICPPDATIYAPCRAEVVDVRSSGWWGLGARPSGGHPVSDGDGIVQIKLLETVGPLKAGLHLGFGHSEHHTVRVGQRVRAGDVLGKAGFAVAWHVHFMVNHGEFGDRVGRGSQDPRPITDYCQRNG